MKIETILFDIGNVLVPDYWETLWLTKDRGLADRLGIPVEVAAATGKRLWHKYDRIASAEIDYWREIEADLHQAIPSDIVMSVEAELIEPNPFAREALIAARASDLKVGLISNNTTFWAPKQLDVLNCADLIDPSLIFLSCDKGAAKGGTPDLFEIAAKAVDPAVTLVVDDRQGNIAVAGRFGFATYLYPHEQCTGARDDGYYRAGPYGPFRLDHIMIR